ncbi:uncharacterized protein Dwil_GK10941 [Drosophila willistoni]|uniref:Histone-lysine N-methyltransferase Set8 n=1 Tax=Drosophila willistoni TaxID=7260 RepID=B4N949_DROWI|nr:histone-lysine N-methyltransferase PR-Set7 [Drosophila willistoni]EDW81596.2 uncharacterized protein Dwil_GK10941 [Drosophila willistoni]
MIMVRRRARPAKGPMVGATTATTDQADASAEPLSLNVTEAAMGVAAANLLDDQYFASPKRKDCRLMKANENLTKTTIEANTEPSAGRTIGVPLATRSQTRTIENFFKANAAAKNANTNPNPNLNPNKEQKTISATHTELALVEDVELTVEELQFDGHSTASSSHSSPAYQNEDEEHDDEVDDQLEVEVVTNAVQISTADFQSHRSSALRDSHSSTHSSSSSSAATDNIFLQEPVLTLDIDRTPTKASSIKINKSFELANIVFSSPPSAMNACMLNGRFNQIVSLNGGGHVVPSMQLEPEAIVPQAPIINGFDNFVDQHDSSSCDSGVACSLGTPAAAPGTTGRRRKPATPHRIVCPSPIKTLPREIVGSGGGLSRKAAAGFKAECDPLSPRKSPRKLPTTTAAVAACKSRRRLNQPKPQAPYHSPPLQQPPPPTSSSGTHLSNPTNDDAIVVVLDDDDEDLDGDEYEDDMGALLKAAEERENLNKAPTVNNNNHIKAMLKPVPPKPKVTKGGSKTKTMTQKSQPLPLPLAATNGNREMTDFFPVRRSVRKTKTAVKEEWMRNLEQAVLEERCDGLIVRNFTGKGRGVVADRHFKRNEFVVEYVGDLISIGDASERERRYALDENAGCYMYYFKHKTQQYCIDATVDTGKLGRLINHSRNGNLMTKVVVIKQRPHLVLLAKDDIEPGTELTYDYGDRSKESLLHHPWLAF